MTTSWKTNEIIKATKGKCSGSWEVSHVVIDSRKVASGALFVALKGAHADGHDHVASALQQGAVAAIVSHYVPDVAPEKQVLVKDVAAALSALGKAARDRSKAKFIGVTGSVGKTGAKEMLHKVLSACGKTHATSGNYNNHLGVPLTLANMPLDAKYAVIEMGMNHAGEIKALGKMARPDVSLITTIDAVHLEHFDSVKAIADAKCEIFSGMQGGGVAVLNQDNAYFAQCKKSAERYKLDRVLGFGSHKNAWARLTRYAISDGHSQIEAEIGGTLIQFSIGAIGKHWAVSALAVLGCVEALGEDLAKAAQALRHFSEPDGRGQIRKLAFKTGQLKLIDDSYNASPVSVEAAIEKVANLRDSIPQKCRTIVVLGDMLELGDHAEEMHIGLVPSLINNQMDLVFAAGSFMRHLYEALPPSMQGAYAPTSEALAPKVIESLIPDDLVLVKGSRGSKMEVVVSAIETYAAQDMGE
jgi:UDP-N-acetylmuramoyl-tripeptide--D-alanyl-D-alanine ligase